MNFKYKNNNIAISKPISMPITIPTQMAIPIRNTSNFEELSNKEICYNNHNINSYIISNNDITNKTTPTENIDLLYNNCNSYNINSNSFFPSDNNIISNNNIKYLQLLDLKSKVSASSYEDFYINKYFL